MKSTNLIIYIILLSSLIAFSFEYYHLKKNKDALDCKYNKLYGKAIELQHIATYYSQHGTTINFIDAAPLTAMILPEKPVIKLGEIYKAEIILADYRLNTNLSIKVQGNGLEVRDGESKYSIRPRIPGLHEFEGEIFLENKRIDFKSTYYVGEKD